MVRGRPAGPPGLIPVVRVRWRIDGSKDPYGRRARRGRRLHILARQRGVTAPGRWALAATRSSGHQRAYLQVDPEDAAAGRPRLLPFPLGLQFTSPTPANREYPCATSTSATSMSSPKVKRGSSAD
jgi:hypothetical protein